MYQPKVVQTYAQECGICAIKNLLKCYHLSYHQVSKYITYSKQGNSLEELKEVLKHYFQTVLVAKMELKQLQNLKQISPFILVLLNKQQYHFVVVKKKKRKQFVILDSARTQTQLLSFDKLCMSATDMVLLVEHPIKQKKVKKQRVKRSLLFYIAPIFSVTESVLIMQLSLAIQKIVDQNKAYIYFYILFQLFLQILFFFKSKVFLKIFQKIDQNEILQTCYSIYHLKPSFLKERSTEEIVYRMQDVYQSKALFLTFLFEFVGNCSLLLFSFFLLFTYHFSFLLLPIFFIPIFLYCYHNLKKQRQLKEQKRELEVRFFEQIRQDLQTSQCDESHFKTCNQTLIQYQKIAYDIEKNEIYKNHLLFFIQNSLMTLLLLIYCFDFFPSFSIGKFIVGLQISSLVVQPFFEILMQMSQYTNYQLLKMRVEELKKNTDKEN